jgi:hypothetical protein
VSPARAASAAAAYLCSALLLSAFSATPLVAQDDPSDRLGTWFQYFGDNRISDRFSIHTEVEYWTWETISNPHVLILRPAVNFHLRDGPFFSLGYTYVKSWPFAEEGIGTKQNHFFQQLILRSPVWRVRFFHRYRFEERWIRFDETEGTDFSTRLRYMLLLQLPLTRKTIQPNTLFLASYNELFINTGGRERAYDQNRVYVALAYQITRNMCFHTGFLWQIFQDRTFRRLQFAFFLNPDLR